MSAHRKPGPAVLGPASYTGWHRSRTTSDTGADLVAEYIRMRFGRNLAEEQQREADRVAGEALRLRTERLNRVTQGFSKSVRDFLGGGS